MTVYQGEDDSLIMIATHHASTMHFPEICSMIGAPTALSIADDDLCSEVLGVKANNSSLFALVNDKEQRVKVMID